MSEENRKIEVVQGDGKELDISEVSDHLSISKPKIKANKGNIVIPPGKPNKNNEDDEDEDEDEDNH